MRTCNYANCEHEDEYNAQNKVLDKLGKRNHALKLENEQIRGQLAEARRELRDANHRAMDAYRELLALRTQYEELMARLDPYWDDALIAKHGGVPPSTACLETKETE